MLRKTQRRFTRSFTDTLDFPVIGRKIEGEELYFLHLINGSYAVHKAKICEGLGCESSPTRIEGARVPNHATLF